MERILTNGNKMDRIKKKKPYGCKRKRRDTYDLVRNERKKKRIGIFL